MLLTQKEKSSYMHVTVLYSYGLFPSILLNYLNIWVMYQQRFY